MYRIMKAFDRVAPTYDHWYEQPKGRQVFEVELKAVEGLLPGSGNGVEVGAGTGVFAERLTSKRRLIICLDPSPAMLDRAASRGLPAILASATSFPFRDECLGFAYMITVLEFLEDPSTALKGVSGALKPGAPIVLLTINRESQWGELYERLGASGDPIFSNARLYNPGEVGSILDKAGLGVSKAFGTLTAGPESPNAGEGRVPIGPGAGVLLFKAIKTWI